jgi:hypothetical protein
MSVLARLSIVIAAVCACGAIAATVSAAQSGVDRLPVEALDVSPPSARVSGTPGTMAVKAAPCRTVPLAQARRRIVDIAAQEWAFFGFRTVDRTDVAAVAEAARARSRADQERRSGARPRAWLPADEATRVAASIAGYWAVTPEGPWIVGRQNEEWTGPDGLGARWNAPWSAAFISWVMCEAGLSQAAQFQRAVAHHAYIDQAIRARDGGAAQAAFVAHDVGEVAIAPGDLVCSSRRPVYRTLAERRRQMGVGARTHCDIVVELDVTGNRILAIGGNVRGVVSLKLLPAERESGGRLRVFDPDEGRPIFAHLRLRAAPIDGDALSTSATLRVPHLKERVGSRLGP